MPGGWTISGPNINSRNSVRSVLVEYVRGGTEVQEYNNSRQSPSRPVRMGLAGRGGMMDRSGVQGPPLMTRIRPLCDRLPLGVCPERTVKCQTSLLDALPCSFRRGTPRVNCGRVCTGPLCCLSSGICGYLCILLPPPCEMGRPPKKQTKLQKLPSSVLDRSPSFGRACRAPVALPLRPRG